MSTWILKSPVMMSSEGMVAKSSSKVENSERKIDLDDEGRLDDYKQVTCK